MLRTLDYIDMGSTTMNKRYIPHTSAGTEIIFIDNEAITINSSQRWFWTEEWQRRNNKAIQELEIGEYIEFKDGESFLESLDEL